MIILIVKQKVGKNFLPDFFRIIVCLCVFCDFIGENTGVCAVTVKR